MKEFVNIRKFEDVIIIKGRDAPTCIQNLLISAGLWWTAGSRAQFGVDRFEWFMSSCTILNVEVVVEVIDETFGEWIISELNRVADDYLSKGGV